VEARKLLDGAGYDANTLKEPRLTVMKKNKDEIVAYHYGINRKTYQVERVARTRGGVLIRYQNFQIDRHPVGDRLPEIECAVVFNLSKVRSLPAHRDIEDEKRVRTELEALAEKMKKVAAKASYP
jgi:hypothetical protein